MQIEDYIASDLMEKFEFFNYNHADASGQQRGSILRKYGASTTWIGKLKYRLESRRNGGCPILAIGMKKPCVINWNEGYIDENTMSST